MAPAGGLSLSQHTSCFSWSGPAFSSLLQAPCSSTKWNFLMLPKCAVLSSYHHAIAHVFSLICSALPSPFFICVTVILISYVTTSGQPSLTTPDRKLDSPPAIYFYTPPIAYIMEMILSASPSHLPHRTVVLKGMDYVFYACRHLNLCISKNLEWLPGIK